MTGIEKPPSGQGKAAGDGLAVSDDHDQDKYIPLRQPLQAPRGSRPLLPLQSSRTIERLRREADRAKAAGDYAAFCEARRAFLLAQAEAYIATRAAA